MTEILLTHILILSCQEKFMSLKVQNKIWDPQNLIDTAHEKTGKWHFIWNVWKVVIVIYTPKIFCVYKGILSLIVC